MSVENPPFGKERFAALALIYYLIVKGIIGEVSAGTPERPSTVMCTGDVTDLSQGGKVLFFHLNIK